MERNFMLLNWNIQNFKCQFSLENCAMKLNWAMDSIKSHNRIFKELNKHSLKFIWNCQGPRLAKAFLRRKPRVEGFALPGIESYYHSRVIKTVIFIQGYGWRKMSLVSSSIWVSFSSSHMADSTSGPLTGECNSLTGSGKWAARGSEWWMTFSCWVSEKLSMKPQCIFSGWSDASLLPVMQPLHFMQDGCPDASPATPVTC